MIVDREKALQKLNSPENLVNRINTDINKIVDDEGTIVPSERSRPDDSHDEPNKLRAGDDFDELGVAIRDVNNGGRRPGDTNIPDEIRQLIALDQTSCAQDIKDTLGVCEQTVTNIRGPKGIGLKDEFKNQLAAKVQTAQDKAIDKMLEAFKFVDFTDETKMRKTSLRDVSTIMVNMAKITDISRDRDPSNDRAKIIVYAPKIRQTNNYNSVSVEE